MRKFGLIGRKLDHSFSGEYFKTKFLMDEIDDAQYDLYPMESDALATFLKETDLQGFNVTIPFKSEIIQYLDEVDPQAYEIGAVNTVVKISDGWKGYNTDHIGFRESLALFRDRDIGKALILGSGGAAKAVAKAFDDLDVPYNMVSRNPEEAQWAYDRLTPPAFKKFGIIVNTTPLGSYPDIEGKPAIPYNELEEGQILYDLVYNPEVTAFMREGMKRNCPVKNGYEMLSLQAEESWKIWNEETETE